LRRRNSPTASRSSTCARGTRTVTRAPDRAALLFALGNYLIGQYLYHAFSGERHPWNPADA
jgi:hypothetical protein